VQQLSWSLMRDASVNGASFNKPDFREKVEGLTEEPKKIRQLERELREVKLEHEILKKAAAGALYASFSVANDRFRFIKAKR